MNGKVVAIIQARMGSTRLPGKVLMDIAGRPALWHVVHRTAMAHGVDEVVVATSTLPADDAISAFCNTEGIPCHRGSEADVLSRYLDAARAHAADIVVRITADCPMHDPDVITEAITAFRTSGADYASNTVQRTFPDGLDVEVFSFDALEETAAEATAADEREHVTPGIWRHPERFIITHVTQGPDRSLMRWTLDHPEDLTFIREVFSRMPGPDFGQTDLIDLLEAEPRLSAINAHLVLPTDHDS